MYKLKWNDSIASIFYKDLWCNKSGTNQAKKELFDKSELFELEFIGSEKSSSLVTFSLKEKRTEEQIIKLSTVRNVDAVYAKLQKNYDVFKRPRRQDFEGLLIENGAVYATTKKAFLDSKNRVSGTIGLIEIPEESLTEIDSLSDWNMVELLLAERQKKQKKQQRIDYLVLDVDGVFTDGCVYYDANGELAKKFDMRDGMGLEILRQHEVEVIVVTSENSELVAKRMQKLNIKHAFLGVKDKFSFLHNVMQKQNINWSQIAYVGDDVNDLACLCTAAWSFAPQNATTVVKQHVDFVLNNNSANGAIREVSEWIMKYNKRF